MPNLLNRKLEKLQVQSVGNTIQPPKQLTNNKDTNDSYKKYKKDYLDSFTKNCTESAPVLMGLTSLWTVLVMKEKNLPVQKAMKSTLAKFFFPVLIISSGIAAGIETKNNKKM